MPLEKIVRVSDEPPVRPGQLEVVARARPRGCTAAPASGRCPRACRTRSTSGVASSSGGVMKKWLRWPLSERTRRVQEGAPVGAHEHRRPDDLERLLGQADDVVLAAERLDPGDLAVAPVDEVRRAADAPRAIASSTRVMSACAAASSPGATSGSGASGTHCGQISRGQPEHLGPRTARWSRPGPLEELLGGHVGARACGAASGRTGRVPRRPSPLARARTSVSSAVRKRSSAAFASAAAASMGATSSGASPAAARVRASSSARLDQLRDARQLLERGVQVEQRDRSVGQPGERAEGRLEEGGHARHARGERGAPVRPRRVLARQQQRTGRRPAWTPPCSGSHASSRSSSSPKRCCAMSSSR